MVSVWTLGTYFASGLILAGLLGFLLGAASVTFHLHYDAHGYLATHRSLIRAAFRILCGSFAVTAFILGLRGVLPGTKTHGT